MGGGGGRVTVEMAAYDGPTACGDVVVAVWWCQGSSLSPLQV